MAKPSEHPQKTVDASGTGWSPKFPTDFKSLRATRFSELVEQYDAWHVAEPFNGPLPVSDGWLEITPQLAEELLRRNMPGANRTAVFSVVHYYAGMMENGEWPKTGQPIIFSVTGKLLDGQHRLWASLLSGMSFPTFVVTNVPEHSQLFAYIDNSKPRNPASALQTAGYNGVSTLIANVVKMAQAAGGFTPAKTTPIARLAPFEIVRLVEGTYPNAQRASRLASSDWKGAVDVLGEHKDVVAYLGMLILDAFGQEVADDFFGELADQVNEYPPEGPVMKLRVLMAKDAKNPKGPMARHQVLGNAIIAFNAWKKGIESMGRRWDLSLSDEYPTLDTTEADEIAEAAE
jgi:hypothetical protein